MLTNPYPFTTSAWDGWWNWFITLALGALANGFKQDVGLSASKGEKIISDSLAGVDRFTMEQTDWQDPSGYYADDGALDGGSSWIGNYDD